MEKHLSKGLCEKLVKAGFDKHCDKWYDNHSEFGEGWILVDEPEMDSPIPAYDFLDVLVKYAKEFFNEASASCCGAAIYWLLLEGKKQEIMNDYIWEHCLFNNQKQK